MKVEPPLAPLSAYASSLRSNSKMEKPFNESGIFNCSKFYLYNSCLLLQKNLEKFSHINQYYNWSFKYKTIQIPKVATTKIIKG